MRCQRQGVAPNKTILTPASSTAPSSTPSEASAPVRWSEHIHVSWTFLTFTHIRSHSILVGRPQFGSRPNLYKTSTASSRTLKSGSHLGQSGQRGMRGESLSGGRGNISTFRIFQIRLARPGRAYDPGQGWIPGATGRRRRYWTRQTPRRATSQVSCWVFTLILWELYKIGSK